MALLSLGAKSAPNTSHLLNRSAHFLPVVALAVGIHEEHNLPSDEMGTVQIRKPEAC